MREPSILKPGLVFMQASNFMIQPSTLWNGKSKRPLQSVWSADAETPRYGARSSPTNDLSQPLLSINQSLSNGEEKQGSKPFESTLRNQCSLKKDKEK